MFDHNAFVILIAVAVAAGAYVLATAVFGKDNGKIRERLKNGGTPGGGGNGGSAGAVAVGGARAAFVPLLQRIGAAAANPFMPKKRETVSSIRRQLGQAGIYSASAVKLMTGAKVISLCAGLVGGYVAGTMTKNFTVGISLGGLIGYLAPSFWLKSRIKKNQRALTVGLPDAMDLMVVCVEAGLTVDAAMQRVGQELGIAHPALSRELGIAHMETRVGLSRGEALKNLGTRTGNGALQSLAAMLVQAERFGTSIATALRVHADTLRTNRQLAAEEMAAKASVKMSFPLVLFIFPATFIVLCGPTVIGLMNSSFMNE
jgi:tight adherence protein C